MATGNYDNLATKIYAIKEPLHLNTKDTRQKTLLKGTGPEFYNMDYAALCKQMGTWAAIEKVNQYKNLSKQHASCKEFIIHSCKLLATYHSSELSAILSRKISLFYSPITNISNQKALSVTQIAELIRGPRFKAQTDHLRALTDKKLNRQYKAKNFCYATFSGLFNKRAEAGLVRHSGLICIDLDHLGNNLERVRSTVNSDPATVLSFISPNGDGLKVVYEMDPDKQLQESSYRAFSSHLTKICSLGPAAIDKSCKDVSRACFLPHDPEVFINPDLI
jgi:hypothetical protein